MFDDKYKTRMFFYKLYEIGFVALFSSFLYIQFDFLLLSILLGFIGYKASDVDYPVAVGILFVLLNVLSLSSKGFEAKYVIIFVLATIAYFVGLIGNNILYKK